MTHTTHVTYLTQPTHMIRLTYTTQRVLAEPQGIGRAREQLCRFGT